MTFMIKLSIFEKRRHSFGLLSSNRITIQNICLKMNVSSNLILCTYSNDSEAFLQRNWSWIIHLMSKSNHFPRFGTWEREEEEEGKKEYQRKVNQLKLNVNDLKLSMTLNLSIWMEELKKKLSCDCNCDGGGDTIAFVTSFPFLEFSLRWKWKASDRTVRISWKYINSILWGKRKTKINKYLHIDFRSLILLRTTYIYKPMKYTFWFWVHKLKISCNWKQLCSCHCLGICGLVWGTSISTITSYRFKRRKSEIMKKRNVRFTFFPLSNCWKWCYLLEIPSKLNDFRHVWLNMLFSYNLYILFFFFFLHFHSRVSISVANRLRLLISFYSFLIEKRKKIIKKK